MRVSYTTSARHNEQKTIEHDLTDWLTSNLSNKGIEGKLLALKNRAILFTEDMLAKHPERIGQVADILDVLGWDYQLHDSAS